jgi:hypothetical protein
METQKIITNTIQTINQTISKGQFIRNGGNRLFQITGINDTQIQLTSINGESVKNSLMSKSVFVKLFYMGNYSQVKSKETFTNEMIESKKIGADRFLIK